jgi:hypothetical protein
MSVLSDTSRLITVCMYARLSRASACCKVRGKPSSSTGLSLGTAAIECSTKGIILMNSLSATSLPLSMNLQQA